MKMISVLILIIFVCASAIPAYSALSTTVSESHAKVISSTADGIAIDFDIVDLSQANIDQEGSEVDIVHILTEGIICEYGKPMLPAVSRFVVVPPQSGLELVITTGEAYRFEADPRPALYLEENSIPEGANAAIQQLTGLYPNTIAEMSDPIVIRGVRMVKVTTYPVQYDAVTNTFIHYDHVRTEITFTNEPPVNPVQRPQRRNRSEHFKKYIEAIAINGSDIRRDDPDDEEPEYVGHYLIATHEDLLEYAGPFIEWRRKSGYKVDILNLTRNQATNANTAKGQIQDRYDEYLDDGLDPFEYLLLIGDRRIYSYPPAAGSVLAAEMGETVWQHGAEHADYKYALLEGNDIHPDVALSRWPCGNRNMMELAVGRTLLYEAEPSMDDPEWFTRGLVYSQHWGNGPQTAWHITIHTNVRWGEEVLQQLGYDDITFYEDYSHDQLGQRVGPVIRNVMNEGCNVQMGRAENYYFVPGRGNHSFANEIDENVAFPLNLNAAGHAEWAQEIMFRTGSGNDLKGYVASTFGWGGPATIAMSAIWLELVNGVMLRDLPFGWGYSLAITNAERYFSNFSWMNVPVYSHMKTDFNAFGDPGLQPWIGVPQVVEAEFPGSIASGTRMIEVYVLDANEEDDVPGAQVTLYAPGNMPDFDDDDYAGYEDMQMWTMNTDDEGIARFVFDDDTDWDGIEDGNLFVTVTGRRIRPFFGEIEVDAPSVAIEIASYELIEDDGNGDDDVDPGETFTLVLVAGNVGDRQDADNVRGVVRSLSPWVEVDENNISFGSIDHGDQAEGDDGVIITISPACPDGVSRPGTQPVLEVEFTDGDNTWHSAIKLIPQAPNFVVKSVVGGNRISQDDDNIDIEITNVGSKNSPAVRAQLVSLGYGVNIVSEFSRYNAVQSGRDARLAGADFDVAGSQLVIPGSLTDMLLILSTDEGFIDTAYFDLQVASPRANAPQGPDGYGYICFDDTDDDWEMAPEYDWIEISREERDREFNGIDCEFTGNSPENVGESVVIDLGFTTQFYGQEYTQITICTNGYICPGDQGRITNFQNWPMDAAIGGGAGMIAPLWDWLRLQDDAAVYYYFDEDQRRFIVEWYKLRHRNGGNRDLTFQVIILDKDVWVTESGDPNILIQYKSINDVLGTNVVDKNIPYASVGISSPDGTTGINYRYRNDSPVTSAPLTDSRALLFGTSPKYRTGIIDGWVKDAETDQPIADATVITSYNQVARTDGDGYYRFETALAEFEFSITARKIGYNDSTLAYDDDDMLEDDSLEINFDLLHPEFTLSDEELDAVLDVDMSSELDFAITNDGNGPLYWEVERHLPDNADVDPWVQRLGHHAGEIVEDDRLMGVTYIDDHFFVSGANKWGREDDPNLIYKMNRDMVLIDSFEQFGDSRYGISDLAWDGERLMYGADGDMIYGFTLEGDLETEFEGPYNPSTVITWDSDREILWVSGRSTPRLIAYDIDGNIVDTLMNRGFSLYGLAYWPDDPDGYNLYIFHKVGVSQQTVHKMNTETNDTLHVAILIPEEGGSPQGAYITNEFDVYSWVFMNVTGNGNDDGGDRVDIWQLDARREWFRLEPNAGGTIDAGQTQDFVLTLDATGLPAVLFEGMLEFYHNSVEQISIVNVALDVQQGAGAPGVRLLDLQFGWNMTSLNIDPEIDDVEEMMQPLVEADQLILLKDGRGRFYRPGVFNNIEHWDYANGYQMYVTEPTELQVRGIVVALEEPIHLEEGWNLKSYYPRESIDAAVTLAGIRDQLIIAKDGFGRFYLPEYDFNNMREMHEGWGYQIRVTEDVDLVYAPAGRVAALPHAAASPIHFTVTPGGTNMSLLALGDVSMAGWELGVFSMDERLVGSGVFDNDGRCGIAVWSSNSDTESSGGLAPNEQMRFQLWDGSSETGALFDPIKGVPTWTPDGVVVGRIDTGGGVPLAFGLHGAYPNPTNGPVRLVYGLDEGGLTTLKIYDLSGREISTLVNGNMQTGTHQVIWNTDRYASGVYIVRLESVGNTATRKLAVVK